MTAHQGASLLANPAAMADKLPGFLPRQSQLEMAQAVANAIDDQHKLVVEAGTGTGKTLAYLLPAIASGKKVIVSTATRYLQEQLADKDVPLAQHVLGREVETAVLKGRSNYLCHYRLDQSEKKSDFYNARRLREVREWSKTTQTGDLGELGDVNDKDPFWSKVTSTAENCLGRHCPFFEQCWVFRARQKAQSADVLIINHYLLFADLNLRENGFGELLPSADIIVLDEAHKLPDIAGRFFGERLSGRQIAEFISDSQQEIANVGGDMPDLSEQLEALGLAEKRFFAALSPRLEQNKSWHELQNDNTQAALEDLLDELEATVKAFEPIADRSEVLAGLDERIGQLYQTLQNAQKEDQDSVSWLERRGKTGWVWHSTPLDVSKPFSRAIKAYPGAWVLTSATLAVDNKLDYFCQRLGLADAQTKVLPSPFNYEHNTLLYVPEHMPPTHSWDYMDALAEQALALIKASQGGAFVLCTSNKAVRRYAEIFQHAGLTPLVQSQGSRGALLKQFRQQPNQILIGTSSFWEGVDVKGYALRLVIIDKLPFASPADPVVKARSLAIKQAGGSDFMQLSLPQAIIGLKQGVGRLIRDVNDQGMLAIFDTRICQARYGSKIRNSLPQMPLTRSFEIAEAFLTDLTQNYENSSAG